MAVYSIVRCGDAGEIYSIEIFLKNKKNLKYIEKQLNIQDSDIMNTFNGIHFMSLDRCMYLKIQCLLNFLEEKIPLVNKTVPIFILFLFNLHISELIF